MAAFVEVSRTEIDYDCRLGAVLAYAGSLKAHGKLTAVRGAWVAGKTGRSGMLKPAPTTVTVESVAAVVPVRDLAMLRAIEDRLDAEAADAALKDIEAKGTVPWETLKAKLGLSHGGRS